MSFSQHLGAELVVYLASKESESLGIVFFPSFARFVEMHILEALCWLLDITGSRLQLSLHAVLARCLTQVGFSEGRVRPADAVDKGVRWRVLN